MLVSACGGGASAPTTLAVEATGSGKESKVKAPGSIEGGLVEFEFKNSTKQPQDAQLIRTEGNHSVGEVLKIVGGQEGGPIPDWLQDGGGVGETPPGKTHSATQNLAAGKYYLVASSEEGKPATAAIEVKGGSEGELPKTSASITAREYTFETSGLKSGRNEVLVPERRPTAPPRRRLAAVAGQDARRGEEVRRRDRPGRPALRPSPVR